MLLAARQPENLLLTREGFGAEIKIIDFGLSKMMVPVSAEGGMGDTQSFLGTRGYLAPEMLKREAYDASVDVWALGVIAFILVCGCLPFDDDSAKLDDAAALAKFQLRFPHWAANLSADAKDFLGQLLNPNPRSRVTSAQALEHRWLQEPTGAETPDKKKLLASPKHIRSVPRTPKGGTPGFGSGGNSSSGGSGGSGAANGGPPMREAAGEGGIGAAVGTTRKQRNGSF